jgi:hypothetical protein
VRLKVVEMCAGPMQFRGNVVARAVRKVFAIARVADDRASSVIGLPPFDGLTGSIGALDCLNRGIAAIANYFEDAEFFARR